MELGIYVVKKDKHSTCKIAIDHAPTMMDEATFNLHTIIIP